jgi:hypothetical protein
MFAPFVKVIELHFKLCARAQKLCLLEDDALASPHQPMEQKPVAACWRLGSELQSGTSPSRNKAENFPQRAKLAI